jgi:hypothetical protein
MAGARTGYDRGLVTYRDRLTLAPDGQGFRIKFHPSRAGKS